MDALADDRERQFLPSPTSPQLALLESLVVSVRCSGSERPNLSEPFAQSIRYAVESSTKYGIVLLTSPQLGRPHPE